MTFITLMTIMGVVGSAMQKGDWFILFLIPFFFKVMVENDNLKDRVWLLEEKLKGDDNVVTDLLENAIDIISEDKIHQVKVGLCSGGTIEIKCTSSGKITVSRSTTIKQKREVE